MEKIKLGTEYTCHSDMLEEAFKGRVVLTLEKSCIVEVIACSKSDQKKVTEYLNRVVVNYANMW